MKTIKLTTITMLAGMMLAISCKKESTKTSIVPPPDPDECVQGQSMNNGDIIPGQYIIAYDNNVVGRMAGDETLVNTGADVLERNNIPETKMKKVFAGEPGGFVANLSEAEVLKLKTDPAVKVVEPDRVIALAGCFTIAQPRLITWNVLKTGYGDGRGKRAWILDTGIDMDHPDLNVDPTKSKSFLTGVTSPDDENGHGTHVAGIIGGLNNTIGVLGVASGATLVSLKVMGANGQGTLSSIIEALAYINANAAAGDVVNMSISLEVNSATLNEQVQNTASRGIYFSIAAGNEAKAANLFSPANANGGNIVTVSAVDSLNRFASFSNFGNDVVDYAAPGVYILSTYIGGQYAYMSGTSMAAPHLAGLMLLKGRALNISGYAIGDPDGTADPIAHY
jgi:subtilisin family serine protease